MKASPSSDLRLASGDYLAVVRDFALSKGIDLARLLKNSKVELKDLINPPAFSNNLIVSRIGINLFRELTNPIVEAVEFGLRMTASTHGSLGVAVQCAADLQEGYQILREFYHTRLNSQDLVITEDDKSITVSLISKGELFHEKEVQHFFDISTLVSIATNTYQSLDKDRLEGKITLCIDVPEPEGFPHFQLEGINAEFEQESLQLRLPIQWKHRRLSVSNAELAKIAVEKCASELKQVSSSDLLDRVRRRISEAQAHLPKLEDIAEELHMSAATFKRKLKDKSTSYRDLKNEARLARAKTLILENKETIENIASQLGFSDASNFTKSFKNWTGLTPKAFREGYRK